MGDLGVDLVSRSRWITVGFGAIGDGFRCCQLVKVDGFWCCFVICLILCVFLGFVLDFVKNCA